MFEQVVAKEYEDPSIIKSNLQFKSGNQQYEPNSDSILVTPSIIGSKDDESDAYRLVLQAMQNTPMLPKPDSLSYLNRAAPKILQLSNMLSEHAKAKSVTDGATINDLVQ